MKLLFMLIFHMTILQQAVFSECTSIKKISEIDSCVSEILKKEKPENVLIVFDVDTALVQSIKKPIRHKTTASCDKKSNSLTAKQKDLAYTIAFYENKVSLIEQDAPKLIKKLQKKGVKLIAYTSILVNPHKSISNKILFKFRDNLQKIGLDFTAHSLPTRVKPLHSLPRYFNDYPTFYYGLLSTNGKYNKDIDGGGVLVEFLRSLTRSKVGCATYQPEIIIFVSSEIEKIHSIEKKISNMQPSIDFIGVQYLNKTS